MPVIRSEQIYEALTDAEAFAALPSLLAQAGGGRSAMIAWRHLDGAGEILTHSHFTPEFLADYERSMGDDPWIEVAQRPNAPWNRIVSLDDWVSDLRFAHSGIYNEVIRKHGDDTFRCIGGVFGSSRGTGYLGVHRGRRSRGFEPADRAALAESVVHLQRVLTVRGELAAERRRSTLALRALDELDLVAAVVGCDGRIVLANAAADAALLARDWFELRAGRLFARVQADDEALSRAVHLATRSQEPAGSSVLIRGVSSAAVVVTVSPIPANGGPGRALVAFRTPLQDDGPAIGGLQQAFGLTLAEAAVAVDVARGLTLAQICRRRGVTTNTVKAQLRAAMAKTGARRQLELALLIAG